MLAEAGITMNLQTQENVTMLAAGEEGRLRGLLHLLERPADPDGNIFTFIACKGAQNDSHYCNAEVGRAPDQGAPGGRSRPSARSSTTRPPRSCCGTRRGCMLWHRRVFTGYSAQGAGLHAAIPDGIIRARGALEAETDAPRA